MLPLTIPRLLAVMPAAARATIEVDGQEYTTAIAFIGPLNETLARYDINTQARIAAFLAQAAHESGELTQLRENLNYGADALLKLFPRHFNVGQAKGYARQPERIANRIYADRMGNRDEASGDGWLYRGGGIFQLTGCAAYMQASVEVLGDVDILRKNPERITEPDIACATAGWFWNARNLNSLADSGDFETLTKRINGALTGYVDRLAYRARAESMLGRDIA